MIANVQFLRSDFISQSTLMYSMWTGVRSDSDRMIASVCLTCPGRLSVTAKILRDFKKSPYVDWRGH